MSYDESHCVLVKMRESSSHVQSPSTEATTSQNLSLLEDVGSAVVHVVHFFLKKARKLPFPLGSSIGYVEDILNPIIASVEKGGLHLLSLADQKINAASDAAGKHIPLASLFITPLHVVFSGQAPTLVQSSLEKLRRRGVIGCTADAWVNYESVLRSKTQDLYKLVNKVPGSSLAAYILDDIGSPLVYIASEWLINRSEKMVKHQDLFTESSAESSNKGPDNVTTTEDAIDSQAHAKERSTDSQELANEHATEFQDINSTIPNDKLVNSTETTGGSSSGINVPPAEGSPAGDDSKGKKLLLTPPQEEPEEQDDIMDLFDTWGLGVKAISPKGLQNLRTLSFQDHSDRRMNSKSKSVSFRL